MKKAEIAIIVTVSVIAVLAFAFVGFIGFSLFGSNKTNTDDLYYYKTISGEMEGAKSLKLLGEVYDVPCTFDLPLLKELGPYEEYRFDHSVHRYSIFTEYSYCLVLKYGEQDYAVKKTWLEDTYPTLADGIIGLEDKFHTSEFEMDGFSFRAIGKECTYYPKEMMFIGTCEPEKEIAIIYYHDFDLDYVSPTLPAFLVESTGWKNVVK